MGLLLLNSITDLNPRELFSNNEQGLWLDPSQLSTLYQDSNGVTPCTAAGDPVGLILDQSRGGLSQIGADLVTNGTFAADSDWTKGANWTIGSGVATKTGGAANNLTQTIGSTAAAWYRISMDVTRSAGTLTVSLGTSGTTYAITATGSYTFFLLAGSGTQTLTLAGDSSFAGTVDNVVVRNVPGNHAYQTTSASRPTLARIPSSGRRNLLTRTEEFDNAAWTKAGGSVSANQIANPVNGELTADLLTEDSALSSHGFTFSYTAANVPYTASVYVKYDSHPFLEFSIDTLDVNAYAAFNITNGTVSSSGAGIVAAITSLGSGWYRCVVTYTPTAGAKTLRLRFGTDAITYFYTGNGTRKSFIWGAQLETGSTATNYQKVVATTDVTESGVGDLWHLVFDGSDDSLVTNSVDFTATDEMTVIAGVRKLSDAATGMIVEASANANLNNGTFFLTGPLSAGVGDYGIVSRGTSGSGPTVTGYNAPVSNVLAISADISADTSTLRVNTAATTATGDQGSGNYGNYQLFIGRRNQATLPYNGHLYQLIIRGLTTPTGKLLEAERFTAKKTGVTGI